MSIRIDQASIWLSNHELLSLLLIVAIFAAGITWACRLMAKSAIPDEDEHKTNSVG